MNEEIIYKYVQQGILEIDADGKIWRKAKMKWSNRTKTVETVPCVTERADILHKAYYYVRVGVNGRSVWAQSHRLVWRHFKGPIPSGLTINHKNGIPTCNHLDNLELATPFEQYHHAKHILRRSFFHAGEQHYKSKLSDKEIGEIRKLKIQRWKQKDIAKKYGVSPQHVSKVIRGERRVRNPRNQPPLATLSSSAANTGPSPSPPHADDAP